MHIVCFNLVSGQGQKSFLRICNSQACSSEHLGFIDDLGNAQLKIKNKYKSLLEENAFNQQFTLFPNVTTENELRIQGNILP